MNYTSSPTADTPLGWQTSQGNRGSWDIIWQSLQTLALCAWVSVCPNVASPEDGVWDIFRDKTYFVLLTLLGPEFVFCLAFGQWQSARDSCRMFQDAGYKDWTIVHSFYADMGGIHVKAPDFPSFPVSAKHVLYLLQQGHLDYPPLKRREIEGLGKADGLAKAITLVQATKFLLTTFARLAQHKAVTTLEMTVLANIFCTIPMGYFWWHKPTDVTVVHVYELKATMADILSEAGSRADGAYRRTPLDFLDKGQDWGPNLAFNYFKNILRRLRLASKPGSPPLQRFTSFSFAKPTSLGWMFVLWVFGFSYTTVFLGCWNFFMPSEVELQLWRTVSMLQTIVSFISGPMHEVSMLGVPSVYTHTSDLTKRAVRTQSLEIGTSRRLQTVRKLWHMPCNNELTGAYPALSLPFGTVITMVPICAMYAACRAILLVEDFAALRSLPTSAFEPVDWTRYIPWA